MADPEAMLDKTIMAILTALIAVILLASVLIPTAIDMISGMTGEQVKYQTLMYVIITIAIISVIVGIIMTYVRR